MQQRFNRSSARAPRPRCALLRPSATCGRSGVGIVLVGEYMGWNFSSAKAA